MDSEIIYKNPEFFWLFLILVPVIIWYVLRQKSIYPAYTFPDTSVFSRMSTGFRPYLRHLSIILRLGAISCAIVALARPQTFDSWKDSTVEGIDIIIANDVSGSMLATDFEPDRLTVAKKMADEFISKRPYDRIGLVIFAGESLTQCPLTTDHNNLKKLLSEMEQDMLKDGTAIGMGLATSVNRLRKSKAASKVIILLTDGVNNSGTISPKTAAELAQTENIKVYTIGIGSDASQVMTKYGMIKAELDEELLTTIADMTGGRYYRAKDSNDLSAIYEEIDALEKTEIDVSVYQNSQEEFHPWLIMALILIGVELLIKNTVIAILN